ncbi:MAG: tetratricopeptide repeat protein [Thermodesulfobacteriota bacterium]
MNAPDKAVGAAPAWSPEPGHAGDLIRLKRLLEGSAGRFALIFAAYNRPAYRDNLIASLSPAQPSSGTAVVLDANTLTNLTGLEGWLQHHGEETSPLHLVGLDQWLAHDERRPQGLERIQGFNRHRDFLASLCQRPLVLWLLEHQIRDFARHAPDAWEWRAGVLDFKVQMPVTPLAMPQRLDLVVADREQRQARLSELRAFLASHDGQLSDRDRAALWDETGDLAEQLGEWKEAQTAFEQAQAACERLDDRRGAARVHSKMARIHWQRGEPEKALAELQTADGVFDALGDVRGRAFTQGQLADILEVRGQLDEALRIRTEEELPVYERLGDVRSMAITQGKIADILQARGQLDEALAVLHQAAAAFAKLGNTARLAHVRQLQEAISKA